MLCPEGCVTEEVVGGQVKEKTDVLVVMRKKGDEGSVGESGD